MPKTWTNTSLAADLLVHLDRADRTPLHCQIESSIRTAIRAGRLRRGTSLPPTRVLAADLGVSAIIGAFLAGMALAETTEGNHAVHSRTNGVTEFLVPFFLVIATPPEGDEGWDRRSDTNATAPPGATHAAPNGAPPDRAASPRDRAPAAARAWDELQSCVAPSYADTLAQSL